MRPATSVHGTFETCSLALTTSVYRGRPEVVGPTAKVTRLTPDIGSQAMASLAWLLADMHQELTDFA
jgi:hypothetical protein